ncbi:MAG: TOBE domain-containing protein, partial [Candidatus Promineifilaceae bacterium]
EEALTMSDRIAVMSDGLVQQVGLPRDIYEHPANRFVADFIGETNFISGEVCELAEMVTVRVGEVELSGSTNGHAIAKGEQVTLAIRPEKINLYPQGEIELTKSGLDLEGLVEVFGGQLPSGTIDMRQFLAKEGNNVVIDGEVQEVIYIGTDTRYMVALGGGVKLSVRVQNYGSRYDTMFVSGDRVYVHWAAENAQILID